MSEKIVLSKCTEFELRSGVCLKVYPASLETLALISPKLEGLEKLEDVGLDKQIEAFVDVIFSLVKEDNDINKDTLKKCLTVEACTKIIQTATGVLSSLGV